MMSDNLKLEKGLPLNREDLRKSLYLKREDALGVDEILSNSIESIKKRKLPADLCWKRKHFSEDSESNAKLKFEKLDGVVESLLNLASQQFVGHVSIVYHLESKQVGLSFPQSDLKTSRHVATLTKYLDQVEQFQDVSNDVVFFPIECIYERLVTTSQKSVGISCSCESLNAISSCQNTTLANNDPKRPLLVEVGNNLGIIFPIMMFGAHTDQKKWLFVSYKELSQQNKLSGCLLPPDHQMKVYNMVSGSNVEIELFNDEMFCHSALGLTLTKLILSLA